MIANFYLNHTLILLSATAALASAVPECLGRPVKRWALLLPGLFGSFAALLMLAYPELSELWRPQIWFLGFAAGLAGVVRGRYLDMECNQDLKLVRLRRAPEGLVGGLLLVLFSMIEVAGALRSGNNGRFEPTMELGMTLVAGFLLGRGIMSYIQSLKIEHVDPQGL